MKLNTIFSVTQNGAQRFISLQGAPEKVAAEANYLFNIGILGKNGIPEDYREGIDDSVCLSTSDYQLKKFAKAAALASLRGKVKGKDKKTILEIINNKTKAVFENLKETFHAEKAAWGGGEVNIFSVGSHGRAGSWSE